MPAKPGDPYNSVPSVDPTVSAPQDYNTVRATPDELGAQIGSALQGAGRTLQGIGDQSMQVLLQRQGMINETLATDAETQTNIQYGNILDKYKSLEGLSAAAAHDQTVAQLASVRQTISAHMPNAAAQRAYNMLTARTEGYAIRDVGEYAAGQLKSADTRSATDSLNTSVDSASRLSVATDPQQFNDALTNVKFQVNRVLVNQGYGDTATQDPKTGDITFDTSTEQGKQAASVYQNYLDKAKGQIYENKFEAMLHDPSGDTPLPKVLDEFNRDKTDIPAAAVARISNMLYNPVRAYQTKGFAEDAVNQAHNDYVASIGGSQLPDVETSVNKTIPGAIITSTLRTPEKNIAVGGVPNSAHLSGRALDFVPPPGMSMQEAADKFSAANPNLKVQIGGPTAQNPTEKPHIHVQWEPSSQTSGVPQPHQTETDYLYSHYADIIDKVRTDATARFGGDYGLVQTSVQHAEQQLNDRISVSLKATKADGDLVSQAINGKFNQGQHLTSFAQLDNSPNPDVRDAWQRYQVTNPTNVANFQKYMVANSRGPATELGNNFWKFYSQAATGQITDAPKDLMGHVDSMELTNTGYDKLADIVKQRSTPDGAAFADQEFKFLNKMHDDATGKQFSGGQTDPKLEAEFTRQMQIVLPQINAAQRDGKTPGQLFTPGSKDYVGDHIQMPDFHNVVKATTNAQIMHSGDNTQNVAKPINSLDDVKQMIKDRQNSGKPMSKAELMNILVQHKFAHNAPPVPGAHDEGQ